MIAVITAIAVIAVSSVIAAITARAVNAIIVVIAVINVNAVIAAIAVSVMNAVVAAIIVNADDCCHWLPLQQLLIYVPFPQITIVQYVPHLTRITSEKRAENYMLFLMA